eukprot:2070989-Prymnesium_polylepis.1
MAQPDPFYPLHVCRFYPQVTKRTPSAPSARVSTHSHSYTGHSYTEAPRRQTEIDAGGMTRGSQACLGSAGARAHAVPSTRARWTPPRDRAT